MFAPVRRHTPFADFAGEGFDVGHGARLNVLKEAACRGGVNPPRQRFFEK